MDALSEITEDFKAYAINERCDIVGLHEAYAEWMSLPGGTVGEFSAVEALGEERRKQYRDIQGLLIPEGLAQEAAERTGDVGAQTAAASMALKLGHAHEARHLVTEPAAKLGEEGKGLGGRGGHGSGGLIRDGGW